MSLSTRLPPVTPPAFGHLPTPRRGEEGSK